MGKLLIVLTLALHRYGHWTLECEFHGTRTILLQTHISKESNIFLSFPSLSMIHTQTSQLGTSYRPINTYPVQFLVAIETSLTFQILTSRGPPLCNRNFGLLAILDPRQLMMFTRPPTSTLSHCIVNSPKPHQHNFSLLEEIRQLSL